MRDDCGRRGAWRGLVPSRLFACRPNLKPPRSALLTPALNAQQRADGALPRTRACDQAA